ncbi:hypothetical protein J7E63_28360 [Bacillus sp. ISL-75]|uniref:hypothetical protein n=1 Tax=Bacillus sp. ISL-75 TaxID=2819137 RepID=UPI001BE7B2CE|nr:hypothetical protein [Bacillus sp. ISL-75]MBT2730727.1 hypothetical protein [Bacillus sp. ISL-75]
MFKINFQIEDSPTLRSWLTETDFDPALHLNGFIDITYRKNNFFFNYLQTPLNGRIPFESKMKYLIVNIVNDLLNFLAESNKPGLYELGDLPNIYKLVVLNENNQFQLFMHTYVEDVEEDIKVHWYDGKNILYQENMPIKSNFIIDKEEFLDGALKSIQEFFNTVTDKYPELKSNEDFKLLKRKYDKVRKI